MSNTHEARAIAEIIKAHVSQAFAKVKDFIKEAVEKSAAENLEHLTKFVDEKFSGLKMPEAQHGRDALDLEILPSIDAEKSYPRGTYAQHKGGLWRSYQRTEGMKGWDCIVCGINHIEIKSGEDARRIGIEIHTSVGMVMKEFRVPAPKYKGIYSAKNHYEEGDMVTWGGNVYHCKGLPLNSAAWDRKEFPQPDNPEVWQLAVKRGRDGKDVVKIGGQK